MKNAKRGFTLIELLVVVLIVGILAAVAVPQYKKAVLRSRATEAWATLGSLRKAAAVAMLTPEVTTDGVSSWNPQNLDASLNCSYVVDRSCQAKCPAPNWRGCTYFVEGDSTNPVVRLGFSTANGSSVLLSLDNSGRGCTPPLSGGDDVNICKDLGLL